MRSLLCCLASALLACGSEGGKATVTGLSVQTARSINISALSFDGGSEPAVGVVFFTGSPDQTCAQLNAAPPPVTLVMAHDGASESPLPPLLVIVPGEEPRLPDGGPAALLSYTGEGGVEAVSGTVTLNDTSPDHPKGAFAAQLPIDGGTYAFTGTFDAPACEPE